MSIDAVLEKGLRVQDTIDINENVKIKRFDPLSHLDEADKAKMKDFPGIFIESDNNVYPDYPLAIKTLLNEVELKPYAVSSIRDGIKYAIQNIELEKFDEINDLNIRELVFPMAAAKVIDKEYFKNELVLNDFINQKISNYIEDFENRKFEEVISGEILALEIVKPGSMKIIKNKLYFDKDSFRDLIQDRINLFYEEVDFSQTGEEKNGGYDSNIYLECLATLKVMYPSMFKEYSNFFDKEFWNKAFIFIKEWPSDTNFFAQCALYLKILSSESTRISENGIEMDMSPIELAKNSVITPLPERRSF